MQAANFCLYDVFRRKLTAGKASGESSVRERFLAGACAGEVQACREQLRQSMQRLTEACAGMLATLLCFPLDTLRTRVLAAGQGARLRPIFQQILRDEGVSALYRQVPRSMP